MPDTMRALRYDHYGPADVLQVVELPVPQPSPGELQVRVHAAGLNPLDWKIRAGHTRLIPVFDRPPRGLGCDFAGTVTATGAAVMAVRPGDRVFGSLSPFRTQGAIGEYVCVAPDHVAAIPDELGFVPAAALPIAAGTAVQALEDDAHLSAGQNVLITAAAGGVGHFAVQVAKHAGARVTGVCGPGNVAFVRDLGADDVVDYRREDFTRRGERYDVVFDAASASSYLRCRPLLTATGVYLSTSGNAAAVVGTMAGGVIARLTSRQRAVGFMLRAGSALWQRLARLAAAGVLVPHVARAIAIDEVADAQRAMETGHGRGKIVVRLAAD
jgi:NADPH:quinone reductase-like Zn-dependent oxidoreductase